MEKKTLKMLSIQILFLFCIHSFQTQTHSSVNALSPEEIPLNTDLFLTKNDTRTLEEECHMNSLDSAVQWMFYFQHPTRRIPLNKTELQEYCVHKDAIENGIDDYTKRCLQSLSKTLTDLLMFGVRRQNRYYCSESSKGRTDYLNSARCLMEIKETGGQCMNALIVDMLSVLTSSTNKRIGRLCCVYYRFEDCLFQTSQEKCQTRDIKRLEDLLHGYTGQMLSNLCLNYPKETDCVKLYPKREWNEARRIAKKRFDPLPKSILPPLIEVISSLPANFGSQ